MTLFFYIAAFFLFAVLQSIFTNGIYNAMEKGNVLAFIKEELTAATPETKYKYGSWIRKSIGLQCVKCGSSFWSPVTFIPFFIYVFGFKWEGIPILLFDICVTSYTNFYFYKLT